VSLKNINLLLIEDNPADAHLFEVAIREADAGCAVAVARNGEAAIASLTGSARQDARLPELIVLDLNLPGKSGFEVLEDLKRNPRLRRIPVIIFSSSSHAGDVRRAYELQASCYIRKPADWESLVDLMRAIKGFWCSFAVLPDELATFNAAAYR